METMTNLHISQYALEQWLCQMVSSKIKVFAPVHDGEKIDFRLLSSGDEVAAGYVQTTQSAKRFAFPKAESRSNWHNGYAYYCNGVLRWPWLVSVVPNAMNLAFVLLFMEVRETQKVAIYKSRNYRIRVL